MGSTMPDPGLRDRVPLLVVGVLREALRSTGCRGFVISGAGPEDALVGTWLQEERIPWAAPSPTSLLRARELLSPGTDPRSRPQPSAPAPESAELSSREIAGLALALSRNLLLLSGANKTCLLLAPHRHVAPIVPLGDLYASQVLDHCGSCTLPPFLQGQPEGTVRAVDTALRDYFEGGFPRSEVFSPLAGPIREGVVRGLEAARRSGRFRSLVPKLGKATLGIDLDL
jgi:hypothetical protein